MNAQLRFYGYRHINGTLHLKRYREPWGADALADAKDSPFVDDVIGPFVAEDRKQAEQILKDQLGDSPPESMAASVAMHKANLGSGINADQTDTENAPTKE